MNFFAMNNKLQTTSLKYSLKRKFNEIDPNKEAKKLENMTERQRDIYSLQKIHSTNNNDGDRVLALDIKLKSGQKLTQAEMQELKEKSPELYEDAKKVQRETKAYENSLKNAKTKEDVEKIKVNSMNQFASEIKEIVNSSIIPKGKKVELVMQIGRRFNGVMEAHNKFVNSGEYGQLPTDSDELEEIINNQRESFDTENLEYLEVGENVDIDIDENSKVDSSTDITSEVDDKINDKIADKTDNKNIDKIDDDKKVKKSNRKSKVNTAQKMNLDNISVNDFKGAFFNVKV